MFLKKISLTLAAAALLSLSGVVTCAQTGQLRGHVKLKQADGTEVPAVGAAIDVFRTDLSGKYNTKTDKKGEFVFAGLPYVGTYVVEASLANAEPAYLKDVKAGREVDYELVLGPGDGRRLTLEDIQKSAGRSAATTGSGSTGGGKESAEDKTKRAELEKKNAEITEKNKKIEGANAAIGRALKAGNDALNAKNYDEAIKQYDEGLAADPEHPGAPVLLTNKSVALRIRGVDRYNASIKNTDDAARNAGLESAKKDWRDAADAAIKAVDMLKAQTPPTDPAQANNATTSKYLALVARKEAMRFVVSKVAQGDAVQADAGLAAFDEYIAAETDPVKKSKAEMDAAQMLLDGGAGDKAFAEYQKVLSQKPDDPDANLGAGLALYSTGDKAKFQQAANYLQHFVDTAPDNHKDKESIKAVLAEMKNTENVVPEKTTPTRRRKP